MDRWAQHFKNLLNKEHLEEEPNHAQSREEETPPNSNYDELPTIKEIQ